MRFTEIKDKIRNLGDYKSLKEIKKAGLRVIRNTKTGDYWLLEKELLKPVIKSPRESNKITIDESNLKFKIFLCNCTKEELRNSLAAKYIEWGEQQKFNLAPTVNARKFWYSVGECNKTKIFIQMSFNDILRFLFSENGLIADARLYTINLDEPSDDEEVVGLLNSTFTLLQVELNGRSNLGEGALDFKVYEAKDLLVLRLEPLMLNRVKRGEPVKMISNTDNWKIIENFTGLSQRVTENIFKECGIDPYKAVRSQEPKPLPDRKALDDIVFDALELTEQERREVYWAVCELVKNRLEKARSI